MRFGRHRRRISAIAVAAAAVLFYFFLADPFLVTRSRDRITCILYACYAIV